jgi:hypothetical protein
MKPTDIDHLRMTLNTLEAALHCRKHRWTADQEAMLKRSRNILAKENGKDEIPQSSGERGQHETIAQTSE